MTARSATAAPAGEPITPAEPLDDFARDVRESLSARPRRLAPRHLYDPLGSALFDAICRLPWYRITRAEVRLLRRHAAAILAGGAAGARPSTEVVELGPGNGEKVAALLSAARLSRRTLVHLIDISPAALTDAAHKLRDIEHVDVTTHAARFVTGLRRLGEGAPARAGNGNSDRTPDDAGRLVLFLGSNIGNFQPATADEVLREVRAALGPGDTFLIGTDLVKPERDLLLAYDDPLGVTAAFSRNVLVRLNRELGADFDVSAFRHVASWHPEPARVEIHLESLRDQHISVPGAELEFDMAAGETIWTESSYKYEPAGVRAMLARAGFLPRAQWVDDDARFALTLAGVN